MPGSYDVHFFEIGKEDRTDFAIFVRASRLLNKSAREAQDLIDAAVNADEIPDPEAYDYSDKHMDGGRLDIDTNSQSNVICVFYLNDDTESYFKDNEPILNLKVHRNPAKSGYVSDSRSYPANTRKPKWASFKVDRATHRPANHPHDIDIVTVPFVLNIMNNDTECWPSLGHHHKGDYWPMSHGGIHPNTPANVITFGGP